MEDNNFERWKEMVRKYPAKLIYNNGYWYVDCFSLGKIDLEDDIPEQLELMQDIIEKEFEGSDD